MPSLGADMDAGTVLEWLVQPGDTVSRGDIVAVVRTDKADVEVEVFETGVVGDLLVPEGVRVDVGTPLATIHAAGAATAPAAAATDSTAGPFAPPREIAALAAAPPAAEPPAEAPAQAAPARLTATPGPTALGERGPRMTPRARRLAAEAGIDPERIAPAAPSGAVTGDDVRSFVGSARPPTPQTSTAAPESAGPGLATAADRALAMRRAIGTLMSRSKRDIPHYYLQHPIELAHALAWLERHNERRPVEERVLPAALLCRATALAAREHPEMNGFWDGAHRPSAPVHLGVAIALRGGGLVAPAIHDADSLSLDDLMSSLRDLTARARSGRLRGSEMTDPTITVTNLGDQGVDSVFGVIYAPQVALVGFGRIAERAWAQDGRVGVRPAVTVTLSADHRVSDGMAGARFLTSIDRLLHRPEEL